MRSRKTSRTYKTKYKSRKKLVKKSHKTSRIKKKKIQGGKYRFNYNLQLFEKFI
jgi:hypothetical protein